MYLLLQYISQKVITKIEELEQEMRDDVLFLKVNVDEAIDVAMEHNIQSWYMPKSIIYMMQF